MYYRPFKTRCSIPCALRHCALVAVLLALAAGCNPPGKPNPDQGPVMPDQIMDFGRLYAANCAGCHGATGKLGPAPPLNDPLFLAIIPDEELLRVIRDGRVGTPMPAFSQAKGGSLTDAQVKLLAEGIKSRWRSDKPFIENAPVYALAKVEGLQSMPGNREHGAEVFERACAGCHGPNGAGGESLASTGGAINSPAFLALISNQALRRIIITGRPDLGMPTYAEAVGRPAPYQPLTAAEIDDLVALLADWRATGTVVRSGRQ